MVSQLINSQIDICAKLIQQCIRNFIAKCRQLKRNIKQRKVQQGLDMAKSRVQERMKQNPNLFNHHHMKPHPPATLKSKTDYKPNSSLTSNKNTINPSSKTTTTGINKNDNSGSIYQVYRRLERENGIYSKPTIASQRRASKRATNSDLPNSLSLESGNNSYIGNAIPINDPRGGGNNPSYLTKYESTNANIRVLRNELNGTLTNFEDEIISLRQELEHQKLQMFYSRGIRQSIVYTPQQAIDDEVDEIERNRVQRESLMSDNAEGRGSSRLRSYAFKDGSGGSFSPDRKTNKENLNAKEITTLKETIETLQKKIIELEDNIQHQKDVNEEIKIQADLSIKQLEEQQKELIDITTQQSKEEVLQVFTNQIARKDQETKEIEHQIILLNEEKVKPLEEQIEVKYHTLEQKFVEDFTTLVTKQQQQRMELEHQLIKQAKRFKRLQKKKAKRQRKYVKQQEIRLVKKFIEHQQMQDERFNKELEEQQRMEERKIKEVKDVLSANNIVPNPPGGTKPSNVGGVIQNGRRLSNNSVSDNGYIVKKSFFGGLFGGKPPVSGHMGTSFGKQSKDIPSSPPQSANHAASSRDPWSILSRISSAASLRSKIGSPRQPVPLKPAPLMEQDANEFFHSIQVDLTKDSDDEEDSSDSDDYEDDTSDSELDFFDKEEREKRKKEKKEKENELTVDTDGNATVTDDETIGTRSHSPSKLPLVIPPTPVDHEHDHESVASSRSVLTSRTSRGNNSFRPAGYTMIPGSTIRSSVQMSTSPNTNKPGKAIGVLLLPFEHQPSLEEMNQAKMSIRLVKFFRRFIFIKSIIRTSTTITKVRRRFLPMFIPTTKEPGIIDIALSTALVCNDLEFSLMILTRSLELFAIFDKRLKQLFPCSLIMLLKLIKLHYQVPTFADKGLLLLYTIMKFTGRNISTSMSLQYSSPIGLQPTMTIGEGIKAFQSYDHLLLILDLFLHSFYYYLSKLPSLQELASISPVMEGNSTPFSPLKRTASIGSESGATHQSVREPVLTAESSIVDPLIGTAPPSIILEGNENNSIIKDETKDNDQGNQLEPSTPRGVLKTSSLDYVFNQSSVLSVVPSSAAYPNSQEPTSLTILYKVSKCFLRFIDKFQISSMDVDVSQKLFLLLTHSNVINFLKHGLDIFSNRKQPLERPLLDIILRILIQLTYLPTMFPLVTNRSAPMMIYDRLMQAYPIDLTDISVQDFKQHPDLIWMSRIRYVQDQYIQSGLLPILLNMMLDLHEQPSSFSLICQVFYNAMSCSMARNQLFFFTKSIYPNIFMKLLFLYHPKHYASSLLSIDNPSQTMIVTSEILVKWQLLLILMETILAMVQYRYENMIKLISTGFIDILTDILQYSVNIWHQITSQMIINKNKLTPTHIEYWIVKTIEIGFQSLMVIALPNSILPPEASHHFSSSELYKCQQGYSRILQFFQSYISMVSLDTIPTNNLWIRDLAKKMMNCILSQNQVPLDRRPILHPRNYLSLVNVDGSDIAFPVIRGKGSRASRIQSSRPLTTISFQG